MLALQIGASMDGVPFAEVEKAAKTLGVVRTGKRSGQRWRMPRPAEVPLKNGRVR